MEQCFEVNGYCNTFMLGRIVVNELKDEECFYDSHLWKVDHWTVSGAALILVLCLKVILLVLLVPKNQINSKSIYLAVYKHP